jgi:hypothetical protein
MDNEFQDGMACSRGARIKFHESRFFLSSCLNLIPKVIDLVLVKSKEVLDSEDKVLNERAMASA